MRLPLRTLLIILGATLVLLAAASGLTRHTPPQRLAFVAMRDGSWNLYRMDHDGTDLTQLTSLTYNPFWWTMRPVWSPDGRWIVFSHLGDLYRVRHDGAVLQQITRSPRLDNNPAWSVNGQWITFTATRGAYAATYKMRPDGTLVQRLSSGTNAGSTTIPVSNSGIDINHPPPQRSPDGVWIAWEDRGAIFVAPAAAFDPLTATQLTSRNDPAHAPAWWPFEAHRLRARLLLILGIVMVVAGLTWRTGSETHRT